MKLTIDILDGKTMNWCKCFCLRWEWPLVWKKDADNKRELAIKHAIQNKDSELKRERETLKSLIGRIAKVGDRKFASDGEYRLDLRIDAKWMRCGFSNRSEQEYFAEYVGREVESHVARMIVVRDDERERIRRYGHSDIAFPG